MISRLHHSAVLFNDLPSSGLHCCRKLTIVTNAASVGGCSGHSSAASWLLAVTSIFSFTSSTTTAGGSQVCTHAFLLPHCTRAVKTCFPLRCAHLNFSNTVDNTAHPACQGLFVCTFAGLVKGACTNKGPFVVQAKHSCWLLRNRSHPLCLCSRHALYLWEPMESYERTGHPVSSQLQPLCY